MDITFKILSILFLVIFSKNIHACTCMGESSVKDEIEESEAIFVGIILNSEELRKYDTLASKRIAYSIRMRYSLLVETVYKGKLTSDTVYIYTGSGMGDCGFNFETGSKYIVYAQHHDSEDIKNNSFYTTVCYRTRLFETGEIDEIEQYLKAQNTLTFNDPAIFINPKTAPVFKNGGEEGLMQFIYENLKHPKGQSVKGFVFVQFVVDTLGQVRDIEIKRGISKEADEEAIRVVKMLYFTPGTFLGKPIETLMTIPINFSLKPTD